jgi:hypothetical protein
VAALLLLPCAFCFCFKFGASEFTIPSDAAEQLDSEQAFHVELVVPEKDCQGACRALETAKKQRKNQYAQELIYAR